MGSGVDIGRRFYLQCFPHLDQFAMTSIGHELSRVLRYILQREQAFQVVQSTLVDIAAVDMHQIRISDGDP